MKKRHIPVLAILGLAFVLSGCQFARSQINIEDFNKKAESIIPGKTTTAEVLEILGSPPSAILQLRNEKAYVYTFGDSKTGGLNLFIFGTRKTNLGIDSAYFFLDENDVITRKIVSNNSQDLTWDWWAFGD